MLHVLALDSRSLKCASLLILLDQFTFIQRKYIPNE